MGNDLSVAYLQGLAEPIIYNHDLSNRAKVFSVLDVLYENGFFTLFERLNNEYLYMLFDGMIDRKRVRVYKAQWLQKMRKEKKKLARKHNYKPPPQPPATPEEMKINEEIRKIKEKPNEVLEEKAITTAVKDGAITLDFLEQIVLIALSKSATSDNIDPRLIELGLKVLDRKDKSGYSDHLALTREELSVILSNDSEEI